MEIKNRNKNGFDIGSIIDDWHKVDPRKSKQNIKNRKTHIFEYVDQHFVQSIRVS